MAKKKKKVAKKQAKRIVRKASKRKPVKVAKRKAIKKAPAKKPTSKKVVSYGVEFVRRKHITKIRGVRGWESCAGTVRRSERRFATDEEASQHGKRFTKIENHKSFKVFPSSDKVNAKINWKTGKTNPVIGLRRTNR